MIFWNLDSVFEAIARARRRLVDEEEAGIIGRREELRASERGEVEGDYEKERGGERERRNIDRISVATDSIYPLLTGLLLGGFNFDSSRR